MLHVKFGTAVLVAGWDKPCRASCWPLLCSLEHGIAVLLIIIQFDL